MVSHFDDQMLRVSGPPPHGLGHASAVADPQVPMNWFLADRAIHPIIDRVYDFSEAADAYAYLRSGSHFGKWWCSC